MIGSVEEHMSARNGLINHFNKGLEKLINENRDKDIFYVIGKVKFPKDLVGNVGRVMLDAYDTKPPLVKDAFCYEVDNKRGVKTLLWIMNIDGSLRVPSLNKTVKIKHEGVNVQAAFGRAADDMGAVKL